MKYIKKSESFKIFENNETPSAESVMLVIKKEFEEVDLDDEYDSDRELEWVESSLVT